MTSTGRGSRPGRRAVRVRGRRFLVAAAIGVLLTTAPAAAAPPPRVTLIGDSPATGVQYNPSARAILAEGVQLRLEVAPCRRVAQASCPYDGVRPPNLLEVVEAAGAGLGETVIVAVGYNDFEELYADGIGAALGALRAAGVKRILWATLHAARHPYLPMNEAIRAAARRHADLVVVDWNAYSRSHPDWFQPDDIHLTGPGAEAMAQLFHDTLVRLGVAAGAPEPLSILTTSATLPRAVVGQRLVTVLRSRGGTPPYRWSLRGKRPSGLTLSPAGRLSWLPRVAGRVPLAVRVVDADGRAAARVLRVLTRR